MTTFEMERLFDVEALSETRSERKPDPVAHWSCTVCGHIAVHSIDSAIRGDHPDRWCSGCGRCRVQVRRADGVLGWRNIQVIEVKL